MWGTAAYSSMPHNLTQEQRDQIREALGSPNKLRRRIIQAVFAVWAIYVAAALVLLPLHQLTSKPGEWSTIFVWGFFIAVGLAIRTRESPHSAFAAYQPGFVEPQDHEFITRCKNKLAWLQLINIGFLPLAVLSRYVLLDWYLGMQATGKVVFVTTLMAVCGCLAWRVFKEYKKTEWQVWEFINADAY